MAAMILAGAAMLTRFVHMRGCVAFVALHADPCLNLCSFTIWPWLSFLAAIASVQSGRTLAPDENSGAWAGTFVAEGEEPTSLSSLQGHSC